MVVSIGPKAMFGSPYSPRVESLTTGAPSTALQMSPITRESFGGYVVSKTSFKVVSIPSTQMPPL